MAIGQSTAELWRKMILNKAAILHHEFQKNHFCLRDFIEFQICILCT